MSFGRRNKANESSEVREENRRSTTNIRDGPGLEEFLEGKVETTKARSASRLRLPPWLKRPIPMGKNYARLKEDLRGLGLATVCEEAR